MALPEEHRETIRLQEPSLRTQGESGVQRGRVEQGTTGNNAFAATVEMIQAIQTGDTEALDSLLHLLPIEKLEMDESDRYLVHLLTEAAAIANVEAFKIIMEYWYTAIYSTQSEFTTTLNTYLYTIDLIDNSVLAFMTNIVYPEITTVEILDDLTRYDSSDVTRAAIRRVATIHGYETFNTYSQLIAAARATENDMAEEAFTSLAQEIAPYAPVPGWVANFIPGISELPYEDELPLPPSEPKVSFQLPPIPIIVEELIGNLEAQDINIDNREAAKAALSERLAETTEEERIKLLAPIRVARIKEMSSGDPILFRLFGPANPTYNRDLNADDKDSLYGGCRMLLCTCRERYVDDEDTIDFNVEWFTGNCDECNQKIDNRSRAVRRPFGEGGWKYCFCSIEHVRDYMSRDAIPDIAAYAILDSLEDQLYEIGIQDRKSRPPPPPEPPAPEIPEIPDY